MASSALRVLHQAKALQEAGCFSIVLECIPGPIAAAITKALRVPTIGIGAGPATSGQVGKGKQWPPAAPLTIKAGSGTCWLPNGRHHQTATAAAYLS